MKSKLFLGIILVFVLISSMLMPIIEGVCNYNDGGSINGSGQSGGSGDSSLGRTGAPVKNRTEDACNQGGMYENESRLKQVQEKLNELKSIASKVGQNITGNTKGIRKNSLASSQLKGAVGSDDMSDEDKEAEADQDNKICEKYPMSC